MEYGPSVVHEPLTLRYIEAYLKARLPRFVAEDLKINPRYVDSWLEDLTFEFRMGVFGQTIKPEPVRTVASTTFQWPATWWDHWKMTHQRKWYARWWVKRHPFKMQMSKREAVAYVQIENVAQLFPEMVTPTWLGRPYYLLRLPRKVDIEWTWRDILSKEGT